MRVPIPISLGVMVLGVGVAASLGVHPFVEVVSFVASLIH